MIKIQFADKILKRTIKKAKRKLYNRKRTEKKSILMNRYTMKE